MDYYLLCGYCDNSHRIVVRTSV